MLKVTREFAAACTNQELSGLLYTLFNQLSDAHLSNPARACCHASLQAVRTEMAHPAR
jgi:hypothetical protein